MMWWFVCRSVCCLVSHSLSHSQLYDTMKMKVESSTSSWYDIFLYIDERGCTIWWLVNVLNISNLLFFSLLSKWIRKQNKKKLTTTIIIHIADTKVIILDSVIFSREKFQLCLLNAYGDRMLTFNLIVVCFFSFYWLRRRFFFSSLFVCPNGIVLFSNGTNCLLST